VIFDVVYHCDAAPAIGMGHLSRGLQVVRALAERNLSVALSGRHEGGAIAFREAGRDPRVPYVPPAELPRARVAVLDSMHDPERPEVLDAALCAELAARASRLVVVAGVLGAMRVPAEVDVVVNHLPLLEVVGNPRVRVHADLAFAPAARELAENRSERPGETLLVVLGSGPAAGPARVVDAIERAGLSVPVTLVASPHLSPGEVDALAARATRPWLRVLQGVPSLLPLFRSAGAVLTTYGNTTYEALTCHLPTFVASYKAFQVRYAGALAERGLVENLGFLADLTPESAARMADPVLRARLREHAAATFQGAGIERIADLLAAEARGV
jgi:spore coat polysaccharide biosynthesis predicted glycosyltransferase SpsG